MKGTQTFGGGSIKTITPTIVQTGGTGTLSGLTCWQIGHIVYLIFTITATGEVVENAAAYVGQTTGMPTAKANGSNFGFAQGDSGALLGIGTFTVDGRIVASQVKGTMTAGKGYTFNVIYVTDEV